MFCVDSTSPMTCCPNLTIVLFWEDRIVDQQQLNGDENLMFMAHTCLRAQGSGLGAQGLGLRALGSGLWAQGLRIRTSGSISRDMHTTPFGSASEFPHEKLGNVSAALIVPDWSGHWTDSLGSSLPNSMKCSLAALLTCKPFVPACGVCGVAMLKKLITVRC